ncbi:outer membrane beta-barrel family protein [Flavisolibacter ginsenosidimutans]|uniref:TonB-dependent receptor n=1 Tax=Flavisolibacter ginsenosidimutans TaxID=661481 RepID=A0A5B8UGA8_9BACT|nr:outer membrane beta-barrel family protein [Flavisolibacter ginsenosidimutans]QEC55346.1 TonB-dependent receptor [Flavisolibacter ginsenosidimutans]
MKQFSFLLFLVGLFSFRSQAQGGKVSGSVIDGSQKTIESATISLIKAKDSSVVKYSVAGKEGAFVFDGIGYGKYLVTVSAVGHQKGYSPAFELSAANATIQLKPIELVPVSKSMTAVMVTARKPLIEQRIDRTVVNVEASVTNVGSTAMEVLEKSPGISVDKDGNISLKGKAGVMVLIDGRPTQLGSSDLANLLRSMNANQLDQVEIMTNPPAKFDAAGNAGIINIKTKKNKMVGYNGSLNASYGQGHLPKFNEGFNFNYREGKWNLFTNLSHGYRERDNRLTIQRNFTNETTKALVSHFDQVASMKNSGSSYNAKLGADFFAGKNTTLGIVLNGFSAPNSFVNHNTIDISDKNGILTSNTKALSKQDESWKNFSTNLNFRQVLDTAGKELTADLDYVTYDAYNNQSLSNYYYSATGIETKKGDTLYGRLPQNIDIYSGRIDYTMPLKKGARFEAGLKTSWVRTDNDAAYDTLHNGTAIRDLNRSNHFVYEENINAAYVNLSGSLSKKISAQLGLRVENTNAKGNQLTTNENFDRHYTQLFPTAFLQYTANEKNTWGLNYGRRIRRPNYESLNPFIEYLDRYTSQQGNPNLKPQFSHNVELSHTYKGFLTTTLNYTQTNDIIQQVIEQNEATNETYVKQANIAKQRQWGLSVSANKSVTKWWTNSIYVNLFNNRFEGLVNNTNVTIDATTLMLNGSQQFKLSKTFTAEVSGWYRTAGIEGVIKASPMGALNAGFSQQIWKDKGTIRLNVRDVFYTQGFKGQSQYGNVDAAFQERNDSRVVTLGFSYRFSKGKVGGVKRRSSSANDEQSRVGGGN